LLAFMASSDAAKVKRKHGMQEIEFFKPKKS